MSEARIVPDAPVAPPPSDAFTAAFEKLADFPEDATLREIDKTAGDVDAPAEEAPEGEAAAAAPADASEDKAPAAEVEAEAEAAPAEGKPTAEEKAPPAAETPNDDELLRRLSDLVRKGAEKESPKPVRADEAAAAETAEQPLYNEEETKFLTEYEKDWPDVSKAEALRRRGEYQQLVGFVFQQVAKELKPLMDTVNILATRTHLTELQSTVGDYDSVRDKVVDWVGTQPKYLQDAYERVIKEGTVEEVADLIDRYKRETGAVGKPEAPVSRKKDTELPPAARQAAAALAPVGSKRSAVVTGIDPSDFGSAFEAFADKV